MPETADRQVNEDTYGDSDAERLRELIETGSSIRVTGRPIVEAIIDALSGLDDDA